MPPPGTTQCKCGWVGTRPVGAHLEHCDKSRVGQFRQAVRIATLRARWGIILLTLDIAWRYDCYMAKSDLLQGTLDLLILRTLELGPLHGIGISDRIEQVTRHVFVIGPGSLFPALHRLAEQGWIEGEWGELGNGRRVKVYALTRSGRAQLAQEKRDWRKVFTAMNQVLTEDA